MNTLDKQEHHEAPLSDEEIRWIRRTKIFDETPLQTGLSSFHKDFDAIMESTRSSRRKTHVS